MKTYTLKLTEQEVNIVLLSLQKQPWEKVNPVIVKIIGQTDPSSDKKEPIKEEKK